MKCIEQKYIDGGENKSVWREKKGMEPIQNGLMESKFEPSWVNDR